MSHVTETETHRANKNHGCSWCGQRINSGEVYQRYRYYDGGDAMTIKMHPECHSAMQEAAAEEGGWIEWITGQDRPTTESKT